MHLSLHGKHSTGAILRWLNTKTKPPSRFATVENRTTGVVKTREPPVFTAESTEFSLSPFHREALKKGGK